MSITGIDEYTREAIRNMGRFKWNKTWTFWPRKCRISGKRMRMFSSVYKGHRIIYGPGDHVLLVRWVSPDAFMFEKLRGNI